MEEDNTEIETSEKQYRVSEVSCSINGITTKMLIDTGSEVTIISENLLEKIRKKTKKDTHQLPVQGMEIMGATGVQSKRITKQVWLNVQLEDREMQLPFLVAKGFNVDLVLGTDIIKEK